MDGRENAWVENMKDIGQPTMKMPLRPISNILYDMDHAKQAHTINFIAIAFLFILLTSDANLRVRLEGFTNLALYIYVEHCALIMQQKSVTK